MKKLILITAILFAITQSVYSQSCGCLKVKNFTSACNNSGKGRQFIISLSVESAVGDTVEIISNNGSINGSIIFKQKHTAPLTNLVFTFNETNVLSYFDFTVNIKSSGRVICSETRRSDLLAICGADCGATWATLNTPAQCTHIDGVTNNAAKDTILGIHGSLMAGPKPITKYTTTVSDIYRRTLCGGVAGTWQPVVLPVITNAEMGNYAQSTTANSATMNGFSNATDYFTYIKMPKDKLSPRCSEEYKLKITVTVTFEGGCTQTVSNDISYIRK
jgi:hypothetical protein